MCLWVPALICGFCLQNSVICTRMKSLCEFQLSPVIFGMQNSEISTRITSLYGSQPSSVVVASKTATFGPELQVSMGTRLHLPVCAFKQHD